MQFGHATFSIILSRRVFLFLWMLLLATTANATEVSSDVVQQSTSTDCYATYLADQQELVIPCVDLIDSSGVVTQSYKVTLNQISTTDSLLQFGLKEWQITQSDNLNLQSNYGCRAIYSIQQGNLLLPCVNVLSFGQNTGVYQVGLEQLNLDNSFIEPPKWKMATANNFIENIESSNIYSVRSSASSTSTCTSGNANVDMRGGTTCINGKCTSTAGIRISCNTNSCLWCDSSNKCGSILYNGITPISGGSINCTNGQCRYIISSKGSYINGGFSCQSNLGTLKISFRANGIGRVISEPSGINCTNDSNCTATFPSNSIIKLKATALSGLETGNYFIGWKCKTGCTGETVSTQPTFNVNVVNETEIEAVFKIERCFGTVGLGCGIGTDNSIDSNTKQYLLYKNNTNRNVSVGSIRHDNCCLKNHRGYSCGFAEGENDGGLSSLDSLESTLVSWIPTGTLLGLLNSLSCKDATRACCTEWNKTIDDRRKGWFWVLPPSRFSYIPNRGDNLTGTLSSNRGYPELPVTLALKAPSGTKLAQSDAIYCASRVFIESATLVKSQGFGTCK